jgi:hypothetical protein
MTVKVKSFSSTSLSNNTCSHTLAHSAHVHILGRYSLPPLPAYLTHAHTHASSLSLSLSLSLSNFPMLDERRKRKQIRTPHRRARAEGMYTQQSLDCYVTQRMMIIFSEFVIPARDLGDASPLLLHHVTGLIKFS